MCQRRLTFLFRHLVIETGTSGAHSTRLYAGENKREFPDKYRDVWRDAHVLEEAHAHAARLKQTKPELVTATAG